MGFGNRGGSGKDKDDYGPSRLFGSAWEVENSNIVASGMISLKNLKQVLKDFPDEVQDSADYGKQFKFILSRPKNGKKKEKSPDFYMFMSVDTRDQQGEPGPKADDDVPF